MKKSVNIVRLCETVRWCKVLQKHFVLVETKKKPGFENFVGKKLPNRNFTFPFRTKSISLLVAKAKKQERRLYTNYTQKLSILPEAKLGEHMKRHCNIKITFGSKREDTEKTSWCNGLHMIAQHKCQKNIARKNYFLISLRGGCQIRKPIWAI